jgi:hypothetical protein
MSNGDRVSDKPAVHPVGHAIEQIVVTRDVRTVLTDIMERNTERSIVIERIFL